MMALLLRFVSALALLGCYHPPHNPQSLMLGVKLLGLGLWLLVVLCLVSWIAERGDRK